MNKAIIEAAKTVAVKAKPVAGVLLKAAGVAVVGILAEMINSKIQKSGLKSAKP